MIEPRKFEREKAIELSDDLLNGIRTLVEADLEWQVRVRMVDPKTSYRETMYTVDRYMEDLTLAVRNEVVQAEHRRRKGIR